MHKPKKEVQKRKHCRYIFKKNNDYIVLIDETCGTRPLDISLSGIAFQDLNHELIPKVDVGKIITIIIKEEKQHVSLNVQAKIRWILFDSFGAEFVKPNNKTLSAIKQIIDEIALE